MQMIPSISWAQRSLDDRAGTVAAVAAISISFVVKVSRNHALPFSSAGLRQDEEGAVAATLSLSFFLWLVARRWANWRALDSNFRFAPRSTLVLFGLGD
jgi:hypothetical protein